MAIGTLVGGAMYAGVLVAGVTGALPHGVAGAAAVFGGVLLLAAPINAWWAFLRGLERQDLVYGIYAVSTVALVVAVAVAVQHHPTVEEIFVIYVATFAFRLLATIAVVLMVAPVRLRLTRSAISSLAVAAPAVAGAYVLHEVDSHIDVVLLGFLVPANDVGSYAAAYRVIDAVTFLTAGALSAATFPVFSRLARQAPDQIERLYDRVVRSVTVALVPAVLVLVAVARPLMDLMFSFEDDHAARLVALLAPSSLLIAINFTTMYLALAVNRVGAAIASAGTAAAVNVSANLIAVPAIGVEAAAGATLLGELVMVIAFAVALRRGGFATHAGRSVVVAALALVPPLVLAGAFPSRHVEFALMGIPYAVGMLVAGGLLRRADIRRLRAAVGRRAGSDRARDAGG